MLLLPSLALLPAAVMAETTVSVRQRTMPKRLYHWLPSRGVRAFINHYRESGLVPMRAISSNARFRDQGGASALASAVPGLGSVKGLYTWSHVATGSSYGNERYGDLVARIEARNTKGKVLEVVSVEGDRFNGKIDMQGVAAIHHLHYHRSRMTGKKQIGFEEWVIVDESFARTISADPRKLGPQLRRELRKLKQPGFKYSERQLFGKAGNVSANRAPTKQRIIGTLQAYVDKELLEFPPAALDPN